MIPNVTIQLNTILTEIARLEGEEKNLDDLYQNHTSPFEKQILVERISYILGQLHVWRELKFRYAATTANGALAI